VFGAIGFPELVLILLACAPWVLMVWALVDCVKREFPGPNDKVIWVIVILLAYCVGPLIYLAIGRPRGTLGSPPAA
jgi:hypothetical protein